MLGAHARRGAEAGAGNDERADSGGPEGGSAEEGGRGRGAPSGDAEERHFFVVCWVGCIKKRLMGRRERKGWDVCVTQGGEGHGLANRGGARRVESVVWLYVVVEGVCLVVVVVLVSGEAGWQPTRLKFQ